MPEYYAETYGQRIAEIYDELYSDYDPAAIELLAELAGHGPALELGIGTGRIALPLHKRGIAVQGIDASEAMVSNLRAKPRGNEIEVQMGSFAEFRLDTRFHLIYVVFNTFFNLQTPEEQIRCFRAAKEHLAPNGVFLIEAFVPDLCRFTDHQTVRTIRVTNQAVNIEVSQVDPVAQQVTTKHVILSEDGVRLFPVRLRYAWPSELDLMAQISGLSLRHRWGSWFREVFAKDSRTHISVYG